MRQLPVGRARRARRARRSAPALARTLLLALLLVASACALPTERTEAPTVTVTVIGASVSSVDPNYIYDQLAAMATQFLHREAGYDTNLPPDKNGHDEFAAYWTQEMARNLAGFGPQARQDAFAYSGWRGRPAPKPAVNVEVSVAGLTHPEQVVVIGCHYDGEAQSTQSAYDDASGCAIELGVARAMGVYWRARHVYPARTLRFVIFDAEESGIYGSWHYVNQTANGDLGNIVAMINEEQNGIAYPLRFLGTASNPQLPLYVDMAPLQSNTLYPAQSQLPQAQRDAIQHVRGLISQSVPDAFAQFRALGYTTLDYRDNSGQATSQPIFTPDQLGNVIQQDDTLGGSDEIAFTLAGLPCVTYSGNYTYYFRHDPQPAWSYPYDQPEDTLQLMNVFANGKTAKAMALALALALPGMLTTELLHQSDVLGEAASDGNPVAAMGDIGQTLVGHSIALDASGSFDPAGQGGGALSYSWQFGDGTQASGPTVSHSYALAGTYTVLLTVRSGKGARQVRKVLRVATSAPYDPNPHDGNPPSGYPAPNPNVHLPTPIPG